MSNAPIAAKPTSGTTPELNTLASIYRRAIERYEEEKAAGVTSTNGDDAKEGSLKHEDRAFPDYTGT